MARVPLAARAPCADPVTIPPSAAGQPSEQWLLWGRDRRALADCRDRNAALVRGLEAIEGQGRK
ncbi:MAG: hypothetical protein ACK4PN_12765 [Allorhizobium sp.]